MVATSILPEHISLSVLTQFGRPQRIGKITDHDHIGFMLLSLNSLNQPVFQIAANNRFGHPRA
jgi:hypothetical protein